MIKKLMLMASLTQFQVALSETLVVNQSRTVKVLGVVGDNMLKKSKEVLALADANLEPIFVLLNSPGGSVMAGEIFISSIELAKARGVTVSCISSMYAASMAFTIMSNCSRRYVFRSTLLLFHPARVMLGFGAALSAQEAAEIAMHLSEIDTRLQKFLLVETGLNSDSLMEAYYSEKFWRAEELEAVTKKGWLTLVDDISGLPSIYDIAEGREQRSAGAAYAEEMRKHGYVVIQ